MSPLEYAIQQFGIEPHLPKELYRLKQPLRQYQRAGVEFLIKPLPILNGEQTRGIILGDEVGLGKTAVTVIAAHHLTPPDKQILVICPAAIKLNWQREIFKWLGEDQSVSIIRGKGAAVQLPSRWVIINYDIVPAHTEWLSYIGFQVMIVDECQSVKNRGTKRAAAILGARANSKKGIVHTDGLAKSIHGRIFLLSGTPIANRTSDLFPLLRAVNHPLGRNFRAFGFRYCGAQPIVGSMGKRFGTEYKGSDNLDELRHAVAPIFIQRKKKDYLKELPPVQRIWMPVEVDLKIYKAVMLDFHRRRKEGELKTMVSVLAAINEARVTIAMSKIPTTVELTEMSIQKGQKVIIGSQFTRVVDSLRQTFGDRACYYTGKETEKHKQKVVDQFQAGYFDIFVGTYTNGKSCATGLTLTQGSVVVVSDFDWVPSNIVQLIGRADRMGQTQKVTAYLPVATGTFDEDHAILLEQKFQNVNDFEGVNDSLFDDLMARLETAPKNDHVKALYKGLT
jgi:SNF2 family DNA or RNA helicase